MKDHLSRLAAYLEIWQGNIALLSYMHHRVGSWKAGMHTTAPKMEFQNMACKGIGFEGQRNTCSFGSRARRCGVVLSITRFGAAEPHSWGCKVLFSSWNTQMHDEDQRDKGEWLARRAAPGLGHVKPSFSKESAPRRIRVLCLRTVNIKPPGSFRSSRLAFKQEMRNETVESEHEDRIDNQ